MLTNTTNFDKFFTQVSWFTVQRHSLHSIRRGYTISSQFQITSVHTCVHRRYSTGIIMYFSFDQWNDLLFLPLSRKLILYNHLIKLSQQIRPSLFKRLQSETLILQLCAAKHSSSAQPMWCIIPLLLYQNKVIIQMSPKLYEQVALLVLDSSIYDQASIHSIRWHYHDQAWK